MALYLDSANLDDAKTVQTMGVVHGITTNPALMAAEIERTGLPPLSILQELVTVFQGPVWFQLYGETVEKRAELAFQAHEVSSGQVVIKIPATMENITLGARLTSLNMPCAFTAVYTPAQVYLAEQAGARFAAPYVNRMTRQLGDGLTVVKDMRALIDAHHLRVELVAASLKSTEEVAAALLAGAHHVTIPLELIRRMGEHALTQQAIEQFDAALQAVNEVN